MDKTIEKLNKLSLPIVILIASIILGGFIFTTQVIKSKSIERQQQIKIEEEREKEDREVVRKIKQEREEQQRKEELTLKLNNCLREAGMKYLYCWEIRCKSIDQPGCIRLPSDLSQQCNDIEKEAKEDCFKKYPQK
jgi:hypothetical protein